jgi:hypothetical protein
VPPNVLTVIEFPDLGFSDSSLEQLIRHHDENRKQTNSMSVLLFIF